MLCVPIMLFRVLMNKILPLQHAFFATRHDNEFYVTHQDILEYRESQPLPWASKNSVVFQWQSGVPGI